MIRFLGNVEINKDKSSKYYKFDFSFSHEINNQNYAIFDDDENFYFMDGKIYTSIQNHPNVFLKETDIVQQFNFIKNNKKIISSLEGSFNFIHFNKIDGTLEIIRDRWGSKTFFYSIYKNKILFSSSLNGILQDSLEDLSLNKKKLHDF